MVGKRMESLKKKLAQRIEEAIREEISIVPYNPEWPILFAREAQFLRSMLPEASISRIEHFGSTAIPGLSAKPIIDILVEVGSLDETQKQIVPIMESEGYDYFWRTDIEPPYAWFIKRDAEGRRSHHIHMVEAGSSFWDRLYFRDYLREFPADAKRYEELKHSLSEKYPHDRVAFTDGKNEFVTQVTERARRYFKGSRPRREP